MNTKDPQQANKVTARHVANRASVSVGTVSKALSGRGAVRHETRQRIIQAARELGYRPGGLNFDAPPNKTIGVITNDHVGRLTVPVLLGAIDVFGEHEIALLIFDGRGDPIREQYFVDSLLNRKVDGILVAGNTIAARASIGLRSGPPVVYALAWSDDNRDISIAPDDAQAASAATQHLLSSGRRQIVFVGGARDASSVRLASVREELAANGLELVGQPLFGQWTERWGRQAALQLLRAGQVFDGVVCGNDQLARGVLEVFHEKGVQVPGGVGVIGFDNWEAMVEASRPPLSTMDLSLHEVGRVAARTLRSAIEGNPIDPGVRKIASVLIPRDSTAVS